MIPVAVSLLSHLEMNSCMGNEHSFRAFRNECQAKSVCTRCWSIDKWFDKNVTMSWWWILWYSVRCKLVQTIVPPIVVVPYPTVKVVLIDGHPFWMCVWAIDLASKSIRTFKLSKNVKGPIRSSWWPLTCRGWATTEISFHVSSSAVIRSKLFKAGFVFSLGEPTLFKAPKLSQADSKLVCCSPSSCCRHCRQEAMPTCEPNSLRYEFWTSSGPGRTPPPSIHSLPFGVIMIQAAAPTFSFG